MHFKRRKLFPCTHTELHGEKDQKLGEADSRAAGVPDTCYRTEGSPLAKGNSQLANRGRDRRKALIEKRLAASDPEGKAKLHGEKGRRHLEAKTQRNPTGKEPEVNQEGKKATMGKRKTEKQNTRRGEPSEKCARVGGEEEL